MKICPFMSHMLGNEGTGVFEIGSAAPHDVVALGYEGDSNVGVKTERKAARSSSATGKEATPQASHLYCLRDTCRFFRSQDGECSFDAILSGVNAQAERSASNADAKEQAASMARELEKFWKFQTKSAAEMISSFADVEKRQEVAFGKLMGDVDRKLSSMEPSDEDVETMNSIRDGIAEIKDTIDARNDGFETLTMTVSDLVVAFEDGLKTMRAQFDDVSRRIVALEGVAPRIESVEKNVSQSVTTFDRFERNWAELMDLVRKDSSKKTEEPAAVQARRREAMKFNNLGVTSFHNGDLKLARDQFLEAIKRDESFAECYNNLGLVYTELNEDDKAAGSFEKAIKLNPELHAAYNNLGYVFYKQGSYGRAVEMYNEALGRSSNNSSAYTNLGNAYFKQGNKKEARRAWEKAIELDPSNEKAQRSLKSMDAS